MYFDTIQRIATLAAHEEYATRADNERQELVAKTSQLENIVDSAQQLRQDLLSARAAMCKKRFTTYDLARQWGLEKYQAMTRLLDTLEYGTRADPWRADHGGGRGIAYPGTASLRETIERSGISARVGKEVYVLPTRAPRSLGTIAFAAGASTFTKLVLHSQYAHQPNPSSMSSYEWLVAIGAGLFAYCTLVSSKVVTNPFTQVGDAVLERASNLAQHAKLLR